MRLIQTVGALFQPAPHMFLVPRITPHQVRSGQNSVLSDVDNEKWFMDK